MVMVNVFRNYGSGVVGFASLMGLWVLLVIGAVAVPQVGASDSKLPGDSDNGLVSGYDKFVGGQESMGQNGGSDVEERRDVVRVIGYGNSEGVNDAGTVSLNIEVRGDDYGDVGQSLHEVLAAVARVMEVSGVDSAGIETLNASVRKEFEGRVDNQGNWEEVFVGFLGRGTIGAKVDKVEVVSRLIGAVYATYDDATVAVGGFRFYLEDDTAVELEAREEAVSNMRLKAEQLAYFNDRTLGRLVSISEPPNLGGNAFGLFDGLIEAAGAESLSASGGSRGVPLSFGKSSREVLVEGVFLLE